jgi:SagB-type dehydrogenase family enzyme
MTWREYHEATKHTAARLRRTPHVLDWANMPDPFRHYEGVPIVDLPADPPSPNIPALDVLHGCRGTQNITRAPEFLSRLLFFSAAISASKVVPSTGYRYALRVNPSSGNLHPTEFHFVTAGFGDWPDGLYHYRPSSHMAEQRALGPMNIPFFSTPITFILTTIAWREAWKYRDRAYRYCLLDAGHAWQSLALAAQAIGCTTHAHGSFADDRIAEACRLHTDEWPLLLVSIDPPPSLRRAPDPARLVWFEGTPNCLSEEVTPYPLIDEVHAVTRASHTGAPTPEPLAGSGELALPTPATSARSFGEIARTRRSALDFIGGARSMTLAQLSALLNAATTRSAAADFPLSHFVQLYLYVHRVDGLQPGVYRHWPARAELELLKHGDQRVVAAGLSLAQDLAGNACVAFSMIADLERAVSACGERVYRYTHFEAGAIGHRLYIAAEALGFRATGIGAFFDDEVHEYLELGRDRQVIYHFAVGYAVEDPRLTG